MASIIPYTVAVPDARLNKLRAKLEVAEFPDELDAAGWGYGVPLADMKRLTSYWIDNFNWRKQEEEINRLPNYQTDIQIDGFGSLKIHFVHQKSNLSNAIPLLFCHGWPGSFLEVVKLLPLLGNPPRDAPAFHIVAPSLPNFGFSEGPKERGFALKQYAETCHKLMLQLGYDHYTTQGGDWDSHITRIMDLLYPQHIKGTSCKRIAISAHLLIKHTLASHINYISPTAPPKFTSSPLAALQHALTPYTPADKAGLARTAWFHNEGYGYNTQQSTKPQTIGYGLHDSPVALLAWIYEKLHDWSDNYPWTDDEILTWVSIYWFSTAGPAASCRIYYESKHASEYGYPALRTYIPDVKLGLSYFPQDLTVPPKAWGRTLGPVVFENVHEDGGHFAAHERPEVLADDLFRMFGKGGGAYGVVEGKTGY